MYLVLSYRMSMENPLDTIIFLKGLFDSENEAMWCVKSWFIGEQRKDSKLEQIIELPNDMSFNSICWRGFKENTDHGEYLLWSAAYEVPNALINTDTEKAECFEIPLL